MSGESGRAKDADETGLTRLGWLTRTDGLACRAVVPLMLLFLAVVTVGWLRAATPLMSCLWITGVLASWAVFRAIAVHRREVIHTQIEANIQHAAMQEALQRAQLADLAKSQFLTFVAHDLRSPLLGAISSLDVLIQEKLDRFSQDALQRALRPVVEGALASVDQLLEYTAVEAETSEAQVEDIDVYSLVTKLCEQLGTPVRERGIRVTLDWDHRLPQGAKIRPFALRYLLYNLINNAIHASATGDVAVHMGWGGGNDDHFDLVVSVADRSLALWPSMHNELTVAPLTATCDSVLGLSQSGIQNDSRRVQVRSCGPVYIYRQLRSVVTALHGEMAVARREGGGVRVRVKVTVERSLEYPEVVQGLPTKITASPPENTLADLPQVISRVLGGITNDEESQHRPWVDNVVKLPGVAAARPPRSVGARVLVVDDNAINRMVARKLLESRGYEVDEAITGDEAIEQCKDQRYELVLMDLSMPGRDGHDTAREIRSFASQSAQASIVALTACTRPDDRERAVAAGMNGFLEKPLRRAQLEEFLRDVAPPVPTP